MLTFLAHVDTESAGGTYQLLWEAHPALNHFPIAFLLGGVALDLYAWWRRRDNLVPVATGMLVAGLILGVLSAVTGLLTFLTLQAHTAWSHELMYWHLGAQLTSLILFALIVGLRWRRGLAPSPAVRLLGVAAAGLLTVGAFLGGLLVYRGGAGVDPTILAPEVRAGHSHGGEDGSEHHH